MDNPEEIPMDTVRTGNEHVRKTRKMRVIRTKTTGLEVVEKERNDEGEGDRKKKKKKKKVKIGEEDGAKDLNNR